MGPEGQIIYSKRRLWSVAVTAALLNATLVGCGRADVGTAVDTQTPTVPTASAARTSPPGPTPTGDETARWATYTSPVYGYTVKYPSGWYLPTSPEDQQGFSSENSGGPLGLSPDGIWFDVLVTNAAQADCPRTNSHDFAASPTATTVDGASAVRFDGGSVVVINAWHGRCYDLWFAVGSYAALKPHLHVIDLIVRSFKFG